MLIACVVVLGCCCVLRFVDAWWWWGCLVCADCCNIALVLVGVYCWVFAGSFGLVAFDVVCFTGFVVGYLHSCCWSIWFGWAFMLYLWSG